MPTGHIITFTLHGYKPCLYQVTLAESNTQIPDALVRVATVVMKDYDQKASGEKRVYPAYTSPLLFNTKGR